MKKVKGFFKNLSTKQSILLAVIFLVTYQPVGNVLFTPSSSIDMTTMIGVLISGLIMQSLATILLIFFAYIALKILQKAFQKVAKKLGKGHA